MRQITEPVESRTQPARISYAQNAEDILLDRLFAGQVGTFVDIGANHPFLDSNTYYFYLRGWRGVNIEPNPNAARLFQAHRPDDTTLSLAISDDEGELPFFEVANAENSTGLSSVDRSTVEAYRVEGGYTITERVVPVRTMRSLIVEHRIEPPDLVSIDVECHEAAVIRGIPLDTWRPKVFVVESTLPLTGVATYRDWEPILLEQGYLLAAFNGVNRFYLRDDLTDKLSLFETPVSALDHYMRHDLVAAQREADTNHDLLEREKADRAFDDARHEELRQAWEWGQVHARFVEAIHQQDIDAIAFERADWKARLDEFEQQRAAWEQERAMHTRERGDWQRNREALQAQLVETQRLLRPYRLLDRLGVVHSGYGLARRLKRRVAL